MVIAATRARYFICGLAIVFSSLAAACTSQAVAPSSGLSYPPFSTPSVSLPYPPFSTPSSTPLVEETLPIPTIPATETPIPASWKTYTLPESGVSFRYPSDWIVERPEKLAGQDGFVQVSTRKYAETVFGNLRSLCTLEANAQKPGLYGETPLIVDWQGWSPEAQSWFGNGCAITPSPDAASSGEGVLFARYASDQKADQILVLHADPAHFMGIVSTIRMAGFATPTPSSGVYSSPRCVLTNVPDRPVVTQFAGLTITEYPIVDEVCHPYDHIDSFQGLVPSIALKPDAAWINVPDPRKADETRQVQVGQDSIAWQFDASHLFPVGAPSQLNVLCNGQVIYRMAIPQMDPGGGPIKALWSWDGHWILEVEGVVIIDGENQNQKLGYDELFEWHLVKDQPFYFFRQRDSFGIVHNGQVLPQQYDQIIHGFLCCDPARYSLLSAPLGARFYALRDGAWWYVIISTP